MKEILLTRGYVALDGPKWYAAEDKRKDGTIKNVYARRHYRTEDGGHRTERMHRFILGISDLQIQVDHRDGNGLHNYRDNLRKATNTQNTRNARKGIDNVSGFKGVSWDKGHKKWLASICVDRKNMKQGRFDDKTEAALAYDRAARKYFGEFALTNF